MPFPHLLTASRSVGIPINCILLGNKTEMGELLGGTKEKSVSLTNDLPSRQIDDFLPNWPPIIFDSL